MEDEKIEKVLRKHWNPVPKYGMRERVLRRCRNELRQTEKKPVLNINRWRLSFVVLVLIILLANIADYARQMRLTSMLHISDSQMNIINFQERQEMYRELMAMSDISITFQ